MRRKILMGVLAVALPVGTLAAMQATAVAGAPQNPITCSGLNGTVTFPGPLTNEGIATSSKTGGSTTVVSGNFNCAGGVTGSISGTLTVAGGKNAKLSKTDPRYNKTTGVKYLEDSWASFASGSAGLKKTLKDINFTIGGSSEELKIKSSGPGACSDGNVGFSIAGQIKSGTYADKSATILACLAQDTENNGGHANFGSDVNTDNGGGVVSAQIDSSAGGSTATL